MFQYYRTAKATRLLAKICDQYDTLKKLESDISEPDDEVRDIIKSQYSIDRAKLALHFDSVKSTIPNYDMLSVNGCEAHIRKPLESEGTLFITDDIDYLTSALRGVCSDLDNYQQEEYKLKRRMICSNIRKSLQKAFKAKLRSNELKIARNHLETIDHIDSLDLHDDENTLALYWLSAMPIQRTKTYALPISFSKQSLRSSLKSIAIRKQVNFIITENK